MSKIFLCVTIASKVGTVEYALLVRNNNDGATEDQITITDISIRTFISCNIYFVEYSAEHWSYFQYFIANILRDQFQASFRKSLQHVVFCHLLFSRIMIDYTKIKNED